MRLVGEPDFARDLGDGCALLEQFPGARDAARHDIAVRGLAYGDFKGARKVIRTQSDLFCNGVQAQIARQMSFDPGEGSVERPLSQTAAFQGARFAVEAGDVCGGIAVVVAQDVGAKHHFERLDKKRRGRLVERLARQGARDAQQITVARAVTGAHRLRRFQSLIVAGSRPATKSGAARRSVAGER